MEQLQEALQKLAQADRFRIQVGQALTRPQQLALSVKMQKHPESFTRFAQTDEGRAAIRQMAEVFLNFEKE